MSSADVSTSSQMEKDPRTPDRRLLHRLGRQLMDHVHVVSALCYTAGVVAVLLLPLLAKNTHISENALLPGSGNPVFGNADTLDARASAATLNSLVSQSDSERGRREISRWLVMQMGELGADCYLHPFFPPQSAALTGYVTRLQHFKWSAPNLTKKERDLDMQSNGFAVNLVGIIRAPQGEGNEAIVLVTPFNSQTFGQEDGLSLGLGLALFARLSRALWTARDIIWVVADAKYGAYPAVAEWLREYHEPTVSDFSAKAKIRSSLVRDFLREEQSSSAMRNSSSLSDFKRAGTIATGLVFELKIVPRATAETLLLRAEGPNGQMPNLDLVNIVNSIAVWRESLRLHLDCLPSLKDAAWLNPMRQFFGTVSNMAGHVNPSWSFSAGAHAYPTTFATLLSSMFHQVIGLPTGAHGAFRDFGIDAVSLQLPAGPKVFDYSLTKLGRLLEGVLRSVNNLLEKWHHSFFLYFLSAPHKYISVGVYMQPFALLLVSLPLTAVALCFPPTPKESEENKTKKVEDGASVVEESTSAPDSHNSGGSDKSIPQGGLAVQDSEWLRALLLVTSVEVWAFFIALVLFLIFQTNHSPEVKLAVWLVIVVASLSVSLDVPEFFLSGSLNGLSSPVGQGHTQPWMAVKSLTLGVTSIGLAVMSTVNYPVALVGALVLVPMCLGVFPLQYVWSYAHKKSIITFSALAVGACMSVAGSPPGLALVVWGLGGSFWAPSAASFWYLMESLLSWQSALFPYLLVIHLPGSVLCLYILFSSHQTLSK